MNRKDCLVQYAALKAEIIQIMQEISKLSDAPAHFASDSVLASPAHEPYENRPIPIRGNVQDAEIQRETQQLVKKYHDMLIQLYREKNAAEDFLETVSNPIDRVILRGYYMDGRSWRDVAANLSESSGRDYSEDAVRMRAKRFLEKA
ncbi:MAG TPA: hypothetical protein DD735_03825 [Clostridiales bacterium]|nr:hypothetical protein [Clostridiales bacterium]